MENNFFNQKFNSIQMLRGIAALFVVMTHLSFIGVGSFGVDVFFCISGFIMMYVTQKSTAHFLPKRLIRIIPLYYLMTLFTFLLVVFFPSMFVATDANPLYILKSFLFIPYEIDGAIQPIVRVGWTINYEMFFYLIFYVCCLISKKYRGVICSCLLLVLAAIGEFTAITFVPFQFWANELLIEFAGGMLAFYLAQLLFKGLTAKKASIEATGKTAGLYLGSLCLVVVMLACFSFMIWGIDAFQVAHFSRVIKWGLPAFIIFLSAFCLGCLVKIPKPLVFLGDISFSLYLIHYYPITFISRIAEKSDSLIGNIAISAVGIAVVIFAAYICHVLIEEKLTNVLKKLFKI